jgi:hypothetical protein
MDKNPSEICDKTDLTIQSCAHCRENGTYKPDAMGLSINPAGRMSLSNLDQMAIGIDEDGSIWIGPDEAFRRGHFARGKHLF